MTCRHLNPRRTSGADHLVEHLSQGKRGSADLCSYFLLRNLFYDRPIEQAQECEDCFAIVEQKVKPDRLKNNRKVRRERWWQYPERALSLYEAIAELDRVLVIARVSKTGLPQFVSTGLVVSEQHAVGWF